MEIVLVDVTIRREWMDLKVGDVISSIPIALANPFVNTVFPLPSSPYKQITMFGNFSLSMS